MKTQIQEKRWTLYNAQTGMIVNLTNEEFGKVLELEPVKLDGRYIQVNINHPEVSRIQHTQKVWIDGILKSEYFK